MSNKSLLGIADIGFDTIILEKQEPIEEKPNIVVETIQITECKHTNEDSISDTVNTGFGEQNVIIKECPEFKIPLYKENHLGEFKTPIEKALARINLDVYSKKEIDDVVSRVLSLDLSMYATKTDVEKIVKNLDFVDANTKAYADCIIPDKLFKI